MCIIVRMSSSCFPGLENKSQHSYDTAAAHFSSARKDAIILYTPRLLCIPADLFLRAKGAVSRFWTCFTTRVCRFWFLHDCSQRASLGEGSDMVPESL